MSSINLAADTLRVTPNPGEIEYNGIVFVATPLGTQRGLIPAEQIYRLNANLAGTNGTGAQNLLGVGVTLSANTVYEFELVYALFKSAGTTSHTISMLFGGTATINNIAYSLMQEQDPNATNTAGTGLVSQFIQTAGATVVSAALTTAGVQAYGVIKGTVSINAGGTFIPQYSLSAAPGGAYTTQAGSFMKIKPIGVAGANVSIGTWA